jgi:hypothetical protein
MTQPRPLFRVPSLCAGLLLATTATAAAQPASRGFVEGGLGWGFAMDNAAYLQVSNGTALASPSTRGVALDVAGGYAFTPNLALIADLQWATGSSITGQNNNGDTSQYKTSYKSLAVGLRTTAPAGPGEVYAQLELGVAFPFEVERDQNLAGGGTRTTTSGVNAGLGGRGELGYHYNLNEHMYLGGGARLQAFSADNVGRQQIRVEQPGGNVDTTTFTTVPGGQGNNTAGASSVSVQDFRFTISFGYRF